MAPGKGHRHTRPRAVRRSCLPEAPPHPDLRSRSRGHHQRFRVGRASQTGRRAVASRFPVMNTSKFLKLCRDSAGPYRVTGKKFHLKDISPEDTGTLQDEDKPRAKEALVAGVQALSNLQDRLYAQDQWAVLFIFLAMDAAGK